MLATLSFFLLACFSGPGGGFFERPRIEFWGPVDRTTELPGPEPFEEDRNLPRPVRELIHDPTPERARAYLKWQQERLARLRKAIRMVRAVLREKKDD